ncbi:MAG TPA: DUF6036 family nucleotidyltransferase [Ideonella sp.]|uniref:DUF6036 family nucleotidyltransferase n=1 Tax=Ideonella sp. TaxID=1929293 RepID=UPI002BB0421E|nr:DUF6036 family nucleotidyltransferase [Ideonella sp.]HSI51326.1 DUF6036 family nucleotidyltransferase [Ideonella sp.]
MFEQARQISGHRDYVVIGSLSVLGVEEDGPVPSDMSMSIDIDCYTKADPPRVFDLKALLGEDSAFHANHGYYLDPVSPSLPSLPDDWELRLTRVERAGLRLWFLDPNDAAVSKYARSEPRDLRWIRAGVAAGLISLSTVRSRLRSTHFLDAEEEGRSRVQIDADTAWFERLKTQRVQGAGGGGS